MTGTGRVGVVLVNYNGGKFLPECLQTLYAGDYADMQVVLADNGSTDGSADWVRQTFPQVFVLALGRNQGFTGGCNASRHLRLQARHSPRLVPRQAGHGTKPPGAGGFHGERLRPADPARRV